MAELNYVTRVDVEPSFWEFLNGLHRHDIIAELIQNEVDAGATETHLRFGPDRFTCSGNGEPVDDDGWTRLSYLLGAGHKAPRKRGRIGIKNHGLKTCFTLGNEIIIRSNHKLFKQTLHADGVCAAPRPGTFEAPIDDSRAPLRGCQIDVPYRAGRLVTTVGEPLEFEAVDPDAIEHLFERAAAEIAEMFIGAVRPGVCESYRIQLSHYRLGEIVFSFECGPPKSTRGGEIFNRWCTVSGTVSRLPESLRERAFVFRVELPVNSSHEVPEFYAAPAGHYSAEISWKIKRDGAPLPGRGRLRYPISYVGENRESRTFMAVHYSGPFISDQERHGISTDPFNSHLLTRCDGALVQLLRTQLIPRYGGKALQLLVDPTATESEHDRLRTVTEQLLRERAIPLAKRKNGRSQCGPRVSRGAVKPVVVCSYRWKTNEIIPALRRLCPAELDQVDPQLPKEIVQLLADEHVGGWKETHFTFDDWDVLQRWQASPTAYFGWTSDQERQQSLGRPATALDFLSVLAAIPDKFLQAEQEQQLRSGMILPDTNCTARPLQKLYVGIAVPREIESVGRAYILHPTVAGHPIFRRPAWKRKKYSVETALETIDFSNQAEKIRRKFFKWLRANWSMLPKEGLRRFAQAPIWPAKDDSLHRLNDFCWPSNPKIASVLARWIVLPSREVTGLEGRRGARSVIRLRRTPSTDELSAFYSAELQAFSEGGALTQDEAARFRELANKLVVLATDNEIAAWLRKQPMYAIAKDHFIRRVDDLHCETPPIRKLMLLDRDLLGDAYPLGKISSPRTEATLDAIVRALAQDGKRIPALIPRLQALPAAVDREKRDGPGVENIPCIPYGQDLVAPGQVAFKSSRGDFWGEWKLRLTGQGLSADEQKLYRYAGVTSGQPTADTSLAFFAWLNATGPPNICRHIEQVIRHFVHDQGVRAWWDIHQDIPCIPVQLGNEVRLVTRDYVQTKAVFLPDFEPLTDAIRLDENNTRIMLAIDSHPNVRYPIREVLRDSGVRSLRETAGVPHSVNAEPARETPRDLLTAILKLGSPQLANLRKRLVELGFPGDQLRDDWKSRVEQVATIAVAQRLHARFRIERQVYRLDVEQAFDPTTGTIWLKDTADPRELQDSLFAALIARVFRHGVPKYAASVLEVVIRRPFREQALFLANTDGEPENLIDEEEEVGETRQTHKPIKSDPRHNLPAPQAISNETVSSPLSSRRVVDKERVQPEHRASMEVELLHKQKLKEDHYAWHCQACLATAEAAHLAPKGSYVEFAENRRALIEAEHVDQKHAGGARHAGNLLILCHRHHHELGDALSRQNVSEALREHASANTKIFSAEGVTKPIAGWSVSVRLASLGRTVQLFFTAEHRTYWLRTAEAKGRSARQVQVQAQQRSVPMDETDAPSRMGK